MIVVSDLAAADDALAMGAEAVRRNASGMRVVGAVARHKAVRSRGVAADPIANVRAEINRAASSFDHVVREREQLGWHFESERLRCL